jgi:DNA-binding transcriptional regulator YiaG
MRSPLQRDTLTEGIGPYHARLSGTRTPDYLRMLDCLRTARQEAELTQAAVAAHFGRPQSFVSKCESGERRIDPTDLRTFADLYGEPLAYFLEDAG